jgi:glycosyltransferase involved in cell wall biosynthesis
MGLIWFPTIRTGTGTDVYTQRLAQGLERFGYETRITWLPHALEMAPWLLAGLEPPAGTSIIHGNSWHAMGLARCGIPLVVTVHQVNEYRTLTFPQRLYRHILIKRHERASLTKATNVVAVSPSVRAWLIQRYPAVAGRLAMIANGIDTTLFSPSPSKSQVEPFRLLFVGKPCLRKGTDRLGLIMEALGEGFELWHTGNGRGASGVYKHSRDVGRIPYGAPLAELYGSAHVLVAPSRLEGFGLAAVEAQACGLPVVAADVPGLCDTVCHGQTGFLVPGDDIAAYAQAIRTLADDVALRRQMGEQARQWVCEHFGEQVMLERYAALYSELQAA